MGKITGFLEFPRVLAPKRDARERLADARELSLPLAPDEAKRQAARCMDCGVPFCHQGCPLGNVVPDFHDHLYRDRWKAAFLSLASTNDFPEVTGRVCPAPCEAACVLAIDGAPVAIEQTEKELAERAFAEGWVVARPPHARSGKTVAVVGSGPAGLAAAAQLNRAGHRVTVLERDDRPGGLLRYGIPDFKLEKHVVDRRLALLEAEGIVFRTGVDVGRSPDWAELRGAYDAVVIATGARKARELDVPGRELAGVVQAMAYLEAQNRAVAGDAGGLPHDAAGKRVVVLGGGDTGSDCLGTALRQRAAVVTQLELLPAPPSSRPASNPWPQWPMIFRTSSSQEEGGDRAFALRTTRLEGEGGRLVALHAVEVETVGGELRDRPGTGRRIPCDLLLLAMGFTGPETAGLPELGVELDARGNVGARGHATSAPGVFVAGDAMRGASLVVWAIADGREAARAADAWLTGRPSALPARGQHLPFGGR